MKKILTSALLIILVLSVALCASAEWKFSDLTDAHWAHTDIITLVKSGEIVGYTDGTFKPEKTVTRAEFVKMLGEDNKTSNVTYNDIVSHWSNSYIEKSGIITGTDNFYPDVEITRADAIEFMWQMNKYGKRKVNDKTTLPGILSAQIDIPKYYDAVKWAYMTGVLVGDDGINLRLDDKLSRAEAASLIVRAKKKVSSGTEYTAFSQAIPQDVLAGIYTKLDVFDNLYQSDEHITNGELCAAAAKMLLNDYELLLSNSGDENNYISATKYIADAIYKNEIDVEKFATSNATHKTATEILVFAYGYSSADGLVLTKTDEYYPNIKAPKNFVRNLALTYGYRNKIFLNFNDKLSDEPITKDDVAALLIQLENNMPSFESYVNGKPKAEKVDFAKLLYPVEFIETMPLSDLPKEAFSTPLSIGNVTVGYQKARDYEDVFKQMVSLISDKLNSKKAKFVVRYYPSLVAVSNDNTVLRLRVYCAQNKDSKSFKELLGTSNAKDFVPQENTAYVIDVLINKNFASAFTENLDSFTFDKLIWSEN